MTFPVVFHPFGLAVPAHLVFDVLAYSVGGWLFRRQLRYRPDALPAVSLEQKLWLVAGVVLGAAVGAKLLAWAEDAPVYLPNLHRPEAWMGGKTIAGGLLGGWVGIEVAKKLVGVRSRTGDLFVLPLVVGIAVGRVGCFLTGLPDHTYGVATSLPWGIDFGDGVRRHPTQLYEIAWVLLVGTALLAVRRSARFREGATFRLFMFAYCAFRVAVEFIKPSDKPLLGLSAIQCACALGAAVCAVQLTRLRPVAPRATLEPHQG